MSNFQTRTTRSVYLITPTVFVSDRQLVELPRDVVGSTSIRTPICVDVVGVGDNVCLLLLVLLVLLITIPACTSASSMMLETDLALGIIPVLLTLLILLLGTATSSAPVAAAWSRGRAPPSTAPPGPTCARPGPVLAAASVRQVR